MAARSAPLVVCLHDVHPGEAAFARAALGALSPLVGEAVSCAVVLRPCGAPWQPGAAGGLAAELGERSAELLIHGLTHRREPPSLHPLALLSGQRDELAGLGAGEALGRLALAREAALGLFGAPPRGLLPPAWRRGPLRDRLPFRAGFEYLVGLWGAETAAGVGARLATWSWDWGVLELPAPVCAAPAVLSRLAGPGRGGRLGLSVAIHPADLRRGLLSSICRLIGELLERGHRPSTYARLLGLPAVPSPP